MYDPSIVLDNNDFRGDSREPSRYDRWSAQLPLMPWYKDNGLRQSVIRLLELRAEDRVLDVGCGDGSLAADIAALGAIVTAIDQSPRMIELATARCGGVGRIALRCGRFESLASSLGYYDRVLCKNVLHLVSNLSDFMRLVSYVLRPTGAFVVVETVSPTADANLFVRGLFQRAGLSGGKAHYFSSGNDVYELIRSHGFVFEEIDSFPQEIILSQWLQAKGVDARRQGDCRQWVASANNEIKRAMQITPLRTAAGYDWSLLRLQFMGRCRIGLAVQ